MACKPDSDAMSVQEFWAVVGRAFRSCSGRPEDALATILANYHEPAEIRAFDMHFWHFHALAYRWDLWDAATVIYGWCSDDGFDDFRRGVIAAGEGVYARAVECADSLADLDLDPSNLWLFNEAYGYVARREYEKKTGADLTATYEPVPAAPTLPDQGPAGERLDFADDAEMRRRYPRLSAKYRPERKNRPDPPAAIDPRQLSLWPRREG